MDHENALAQAKKMLDERIKPQVKQAQTEGMEEGQEIAQKKNQAGAVGSPQVNPKIDPDKLSAEEFAEYLQLPRARM